MSKTKDWDFFSLQIELETTLMVSGFVFILI
jgi:hypothetical protein